MANIVILSGSPRKNGNTDRLVAAFTRGAESAGNKVTTFSIRDTKVNGCLGCDHCQRNEGVCVQKDGMQAVYEALYQADTLVFASPSYYFGWTSQLKAMVDRLYVSSAKPFPLSSAAFLMALGGEVADGDADGAIASYKATVEYKEWKDLGMILAGGVNDKGEIEGHPALLEAEELGRSIK